MKVELVDSMGSDLSVVNAARVSFHKTSEWDIDTIYGSEPHIFENVFVLSEKDQKLIAYLARHNHWTPFAHAFLSFRIKAPIFVARQLVKHQVGLAWNEVSRRYVDDEPEFWFPEYWRGRSENAKQGSNPDVAVVLIKEDKWIDPTDAFKRILQLTLQLNQAMLDANTAPEQARMVLPQNMMTEWIWSGSLAAFARVCKLRLDPHAQLETQEVAQQINSLVPKEFEHSWKALIN